MECLQEVFQLLRILPPQDLEKTLYGMTLLLPESSYEVLQRVDIPLSVLFDTIEQRFFICSEYNRNGDTFRSPWSNTFFPPTVVENASQATGTARLSANDAVHKSRRSSSVMPSGPLRNLEIEFNEVFDKYRAAYLRGGVSSVYVWNRHGEGFEGAFLLCKEDRDEANGAVRTIWQSTHVVEAVASTTLVSYTMLTTVRIRIVRCLPGEMTGDKDLTDLGIFVTDKTKSQMRIPGTNLKEANAAHLEAIGRMIETTEYHLRRRIEEAFIVKLEGVLTSLRISHLFRKQITHVPNCDDLRVGLDDRERKPLTDNALHEATLAVVRELKAAVGDNENSCQHGGPLNHGSQKTKLM